MNKKFLNILCCPNTHKTLTLVDPVIHNDDIISGFLEADNFRYIIRDGIPRFVDDNGYSINFNFQWKKWSRTQFEKENIGKSMEGYTRRMFEKITELSKTKVKDKFVLDIGCGAGRFIDIVLEKGGVPVAIDNSGAIDTSKKNFKNYSNEILFIQADALKLPFKKECIDFAYSIGVLHHTPSPKNAVEEAYRVIKQDGELAVSVYPKRAYYTFPSVNFWRKIFKFLTPVLGFYPALIYSYFFGSINFLLAKIYKPLSYPLRIFFPSVCLPDFKWSILDTFDSVTPSYQSGYDLYEVSGWFLDSNFTKLRIAAWENIIGKK